MSSGAFDDLHKWTGDALPEVESEAFQNGKAQALEKLLPYASDEKREAASVILKMDGSEYDFCVGDMDNVWSKIPADKPVAHLHSHPFPWAQSAADWAGFLAISSIEQSHVVAPNATYSLHKPPGWGKGALPLLESEVEQRYGELYDEVQSERPHWSPRNEIWWTEETCRRMAKFYGVNFRRGQRKEVQS